MGHLPYPVNIKFDGPLECKPLTTETDISRGTAPPPGTSVFIQDKGISTRATVPSVHIDSSKKSEEYHFYTINLVTGSKKQVTRAAISEERYTAGNFELKHDATANGTMSLPMWFHHSQKIMLEMDGTYAHGYLELMLNGTWDFATLGKCGKIHTSHPLPNLAFDWFDRVDSQMLIIGWQDISHFLRMAEHVSAALCKRSCPSSLSQALIPTHPEYLMWLASYNYTRLKNSHLQNTGN
jgi:hypothetical protein